MANMIDERLLECYLKGFNDELQGTSSLAYDIELENKAYKLGAIHAIVGDDIRNVDYMSEEDILKEIKR